MTLWQTLFGLNGRIGRGTFWLLVVAIALLDLAFVALVSDWIHTEYLNGAIPRRPDGHFVGAGFGVLVVAVLSVWTLLSLGVKRAHDRGKSGWWLLIGLIPVYGVLRVTWELGFQPADSRRNAYGDRVGRAARDAPAERRPLTLDDAPAAAPQPEAPQAQEAHEALEPQPDLFSNSPVDDDRLVPAPVVTGELLTPEPESPEPESPEPEPLVEAVAQAPVSAAPQPGPLAVDEVGADETAVPEHPQAEQPAKATHSAMDWGRAYGADPNWPVFQAATPTPVIASPEPDAPALGEQQSPPGPSNAPVWPEPREWWEETRFSSEGLGEETPAVPDHEPAAPAPGPQTVEADAGTVLPEPAAPDALVWQPAPSHEAYAELGSMSPRPANDPHPEREEG
ncbi:MAG TPA: DUF805 domain-containing protein [Caulobacteraceae bacterium]|nr:DUF805 domain-containing protein [Caulobacteraceae bacterium]